MCSEVWFHYVLQARQTFNLYFFAGCVAVRSDHLCGVWRFSEIEKPRLLQVVNTRELATCVNVR